VRSIVIAAIAAATSTTALLTGGCAIKPTPGSVTAPAATHASPSAATSGPASGQPSGKITGSCDYELGSGDGSDYSFTAEVEVENTGDVGIVTVATVSWPQFGRAPVKAKKKVRTSAGRTVTVRFDRHATMTQLSALQSWQERHDYDDGCKYHASIVDTF
jgi:hypothetical protein